MPVERLLLLLLVLAGTPQAVAFELESVQAVDDGIRYRVTLRAVLEAPSPAVLTVLQSYDRYPRLDPRILDSRVLEHVATGVLLFTRIRGCAGSVFCRTLERVEQVVESEQGLVATALPDRSDVRFSQTTVKLTAAGTQTRVDYQLQLEPKFWLPRWLIGPLILRTLREGALSMFENVERAARELPAPESVPVSRGA